MVKRYEVSEKYIGTGEYVGQMVACSDGDYVEFSDYDALAARLAECEAECLEQARLNGMGSEREARILARLAEAEQAEKVLAQIRRWLKEGATIKATDPAGPVLEMVDGAFHGGATVTYPPITADSASACQHEWETDLEPVARCHKCGGHSVERITSTVSEVQK